MQVSGSALDVFKTAPLFAALDLEIIEVLARIAVLRSCAAQEVLFLMGDSDDGLYVVATGWLKAVKSSANGREQTLATFGPGGILNDIAVLAGAPTQATVLALEPTTLWRIPRDAILVLIEQYPSLARVLIGNLASRVIHLASLVEDLALRPVEARLARLILIQAHDGVIERRRWATQAELASQVGTVPDVLNRTLRTLADDGLIAVERRFIRILDRDRLTARALLT